MSRDELIKAVRSIVGARNCISDRRRSERFRKGFRSGEGDALMVVSPGTLIEMWRVLNAVFDADCIVIMQAANTGLTEGSTPNGTYDREVVIVSTLRLDRIHLLDGGRQVLSQPGGTLFNLEKMLAPLGREPHSVIGSSCIGASIVGGVCNNSGGALVRRGPVYTELSIYAERTRSGELRLVNHLGIDLGKDPEEILGRLDRGDIPHTVPAAPGRASNDSYAARVSDVDAPTPARFNADPRGLFEASGSAGKVAVFAVRLDTFPVEPEAVIFYVGTNETSQLTELRRRLLTETSDLPISGEYLHRDCFDIAHRFGKDTLLMIHWFGTALLPLFFAVKGMIDARARRIRFLPNAMTDRVLQAFSMLVPEALPKRMLAFRDSFEHHLILKVSGGTMHETERLLNETMGAGRWFRCDAAEGKKAMLHRFAAAGAAVRYASVNPKTVGSILALDIALRRNDRDWFERLPPEIDSKIEKKLYYGHFLCHVLHQDYALKVGVDAKAVKTGMLEILDSRGAEYPAEHNVGHMYHAKSELAAHYTALDPTNSFNPGIGRTSRARNRLTACGCSEASGGAPADAAIAG